MNAKPQMKSTQDFVSIAGHKFPLFNVNEFFHNAEGKIYSQEASFLQMPPGFTPCWIFLLDAGIATMLSYSHPQRNDEGEVTAFIYTGSGKTVKIWND